jgi:YHS domain-containing protein
MSNFPEYQKECPGCSEIYEARRLNQSFCTPQCKNRFHNNNSRAARLATKTRKSITAKYDNVLWNNRQLLKANAGKRVNLEELKKLDFQTNLITHFKEITAGKNRFFCYDTSYEYHDEETIQIF